MSVLLHVCCGPCLVYPARVLEEEGTSFTCYFFNPNIHPYREFKKRLESFRKLAEVRNFKTIVDPDYGLKAFLRAVVFNEDIRCSHCYRLRLEKTAQIAAERDFSYFSTTLLYSTYQNHALIIKQAQSAAEQGSVALFYRDFRDGWQQGIDAAIACGLYRQSYCGCIFSEQERYDNRLKKRLKKERKNHV